MRSKGVGATAQIGNGTCQVRLCWNPAGSRAISLVDATMTTRAQTRNGLTMPCVSPDLIHTRGVNINVLAKSRQSSVAVFVIATHCLSVSQLNEKAISLATFRGLFASFEFAVSRTQVSECCNTFLLAYCSEKLLQLVAVQIFSLQVTCAKCCYSAVKPASSASPQSD